MKSIILLILVFMLIGCSTKTNKNISHSNNLSKEKESKYNSLENNLEDSIISCCEWERNAVFTNEPSYYYTYEVVWEKQEYNVIYLIDSKHRDTCVPLFLYVMIVELPNESYIFRFDEDTLNNNNLSYDITKIDITNLFKVSRVPKQKGISLNLDLSQVVSYTKKEEILNIINEVSRIISTGDGN
jgi:uncharacterized lipoprotein YehR (DUF1307 family)